MKVLEIKQFNAARDAWTALRSETRDLTDLPDRYVGACACVKKLSVK